MPGSVFKMATFRLGVLVEESPAAARMTPQDSSPVVVQFLKELLPASPSHSSPPPSCKRDNKYERGGARTPKDSHIV